MKAMRILPYAVGVTLFAVSCSKTDNQTKDIVRNVILTTPTATGEMGTTAYAGVVEEGKSVNAAFMADGKIANVAVKEGDRVHKGQLIASLDDSDYRIGVAQLETQLKQMTSEKARLDAMYDRHNVAPNDYEKFLAGYEQVKLQLDMAKNKLSYTKLYAPADGYIATKYLNPGELVGAGTPVVNIVDDTRLLASVDLPVGVYLAKNEIIAASGRVPGITDAIPLKMESFTPDADNNMLYHMKLAITSASAAKELTPGMNITVNLETKGESTTGVLIPSRAIFSHDGTNYVWVYNPSDSTIHRTEVTVDGKPQGKQSLVTGLSGNEQIVETGVKQLTEGEKVNVLEEK